MKRGKKPQSISTNFLTCPGVPELSSGSPDPKSSSKPPNKPPKPVASKTKKTPSTSEPAVNIPTDTDTRTPLQRAIPPVKDGDAGKPSKHNRRRRIPWQIWLMLGLIVVGLLSTVPAVLALSRAGIQSLSAKNDVEAMVRAMENRDLPEAAEHLDAAHDHLQHANRALGGVGFWRDVPTVGTQIRALEDATEAGVQTLEGVRGVLEIAEDLLDLAFEANLLSESLSIDVDETRSFEDLTQEEKRAILDRIYRSLPELRIAQAKIDIALETWNRIPQNELLAPLRNALSPVAKNLPVLKQSMDEAIPLLEVFVPLAGYPDPSTYVVVLQNTDEIRPTGGFIGTVGTIEMDNGELNRETFKFEDVYNIDNPAANRGWTEPVPKPITDRMDVKQLFLRDANWSPDYPTSAERMLDFYVREIELGTGVRPEMPDGLIAINPPLFEELIRIVGPITVSDGVEDITFEADTFFDVLEYEVEVGFLKKGIPR
ncbi:DUF4012 domain-containing protein, partial [Candidatus Uhrbacteria bacterium]|nr:DUF4012 domain-containing protein [Candidatus Uhrbacteria bacterium]MBD3283868.1 DUF4012 domain-containing protein [Candidatus Uhrbacteria bacterium]